MLEVGAPRHRRAGALGLGGERVDQPEHEPEIVRAWSRRYILESVAIWSLRDRPARSRPPSSAPTTLDQSSLQRAVHVLVGGAGANVAALDSPVELVEPRAGAELGPARAARPWQHSRMGARAREVVRRQPPVEVRRRLSAASSGDGPPAKRPPHSCRARVASEFVTGGSRPAGRSASRRSCSGAHRSTNPLASDWSKCHPRRTSRG